VAGCSGGGSTPPPPPPPPAPVNQPPVFTSPATVATPENLTTVFYRALATDPEGAAITFSIAGGADAARFTLAANGDLKFTTGPDFEAPADANGDNVYLVQIAASDGSLTTVLNLAVTVTNTIGESFSVRRVAAGLSQPLFLLPNPGQASVFVLEKGGRILLLNPASGASSLFMTVAGTISTDGERGLLGMATAPDYAASGVFYLFVTNPAGDIEIRRYSRRSATEGDPASADVILRIPHPQFNNHNGGWMDFGPDGLLYLAVGDGGGSGDPNNNAQNLNSLLGKILRIDVASDAFPADPNRDYAIPAANPLTGNVAREIYAYGFRNPYRAGFGGANGARLYIGDVGQGAAEEMDELRPEDAGGNFGWPFLEGTKPFRGTAPAGLKMPVIEYAHGSGPFQGRSVIGGYVYRGPVLELQADYFFADFVTGNIWSNRAFFQQPFTLPPTFRHNDRFAPDAGAFNNISSFGEDSQRNLFIVDFDGEIFMIVPGN
jgi:glucose/arabinose dehydrogenase